MYKLFLLIFVAATSSKVILPGFGVTYSSGQLTPMGFNHPLFDPVTSVLMLDTDQIPVEYYKGTIIIAAGSGAGYHDDIIFKHIGYGAVGSIIMGAAQDFPGDSVGKMRNEYSFAWVENGKEVIYPVVGITYPDFLSIFDILNKTTFVQGIPVFVTITAEEGDNLWKQQATHPLFLSMLIINGFLNLFFIAWNCKTIQLLVKGKLFHKGAVTSSTTIINLAHNVTRIIGLVNFNCFFQLYDFVSASIISSFNVPLIFIACWINSLIMYQIVDKHDLAIRRFLGKRVVWPFIAASALLLVNDNILAGLYGLDYEDPLAPFYVAVVRIAVTCALAFILGIVYTVGSILILKALKSRPIDNAHNDRLIRKHIVMLLITSGCLFGYCLSAGLTFLVVQHPFKILETTFYYNLDLTIMSACLCYSNYYAVRGRLFSSSNSERITKSVSLEGTTTTATTPRSSTIINSEV